jgi:hypothetical protein
MCAAIFSNFFNIEITYRWRLFPKSFVEIHSSVSAFVDNKCHSVSAFKALKKRCHFWRVLAGWASTKNLVGLVVWFLIWVVWDSDILTLWIYEMKNQMEIFCGKHQYYQRQLDYFTLIHYLKDASTQQYRFRANFISTWIVSLSGSPDVFTQIFAFISSLFNDLRLHSSPIVTSARWPHRNQRLSRCRRP